MTQKELWDTTELFVFDIDGTLRQGETLVEGVNEFFDFLRENNKKFLLFTNNSSKSPLSYVQEFLKQGCRLSEEEVLSTADVTAYYLNEYYKGKRVYVIGTEDLCGYLREKGIQVVETQADVVVVGFDTSFTYEKMKKASQFIREGADFVATHMDVNCPVEGGLIPDCGAICASVIRSTEKTPLNLGKPSGNTLEMILNNTGCSAKQVTFVGDRISTDIAIGYLNGAHSCLVLGGASTREELAETDIQPDFVYESLYDMYAQLKGNPLV